jgi:hypothetical protein
MQMIHCSAPLKISTGETDTKHDKVSFDKRCGNCTKAFPDVGSLLQCWQVLSFTVCAHLCFANVPDAFALLFGTANGLGVRPCARLTKAARLTRKRTPSLHN